MSGLEGKIVLLTRAQENNEAWAERLEREGAKTVALPCIRTEPIGDAATAQALAAVLARADWLVFTSRRGVEAFAALHAGTLSPETRVAVVGPATAAAARQRLGRFDLTSEAGTAASLADALAERVAPGTHVLLALAENAAPTLEDALREAGAECVRVNVYRTVAAPSVASKRALSSLGADNVLLASPSAVEGFVNQVDLDIDPHIFTIGPSTTVAAKAAGLRVEAQAEHPSLDGLMEAMRCAS